LQVSTIRKPEKNITQLLQNANKQVDGSDFIKKGQNFLII